MRTSAMGGGAAGLAAVLAAAGVCGMAGVAHAQWNPAAGQWGKEEPTDLRFMTWNVEDGICSTSTRKTNGVTDWNALVRIVAALQPDVLVLQEVGDNSGNGTGSGVDSVTTLTQVLELFIHGGTDPFVGGTVGSYVQLFAPGYDLPFIRVSGVTDNFNRNVVLSRYPFGDVNGDGSAGQDFFVLSPDAWQTGGDSEIRGWAGVEIDLPDDVYLGDLVAGNSHLKSGGTTSDQTDRLDAAKKTSYFIQYYYNGNGGATADPNNKVNFPGVAAVALDANTPVIWGGDFNQQPGGKGPVEWMIQAQTAGGTGDGTDRDGTDSLRDAAAQPITGLTATRSGSKLDYVCWQDSIATARRQFVFESSGSGMNASNNPFPVSTFPAGSTITSSFASDHRPVVVDFELPLVPPVDCLADITGDGEVDSGDLSAFVAAFLVGDPLADVSGDGQVDSGDLSVFVVAFLAGC